MDKSFSFPCNYPLMHAAPSPVDPLASHDGRRHERTHLFLAASLHSTLGSNPVHVRNISASGALIEGAIAPNLGDKVTLRRGSLQASAGIVWKAGRRAGVAFSSIIQVSDWMARQPSAHQGRVDDMIQAIRSGAGERPGATVAATASGPPRLSFEAELLALRTTLADLEQGLTGDIILVSTHPEIQLLDIALQAVERMLRTVRQN